MSVVSVNKMVKTVVGGTDAYYTLFSIEPDGELRNAYLQFDVYIDLANTNFDTIRIAPFHDIRGSMRNVYVSGCIHLANVREGQKLVLSRFFGDRGVSSLFWNVKSNLTY